MNLGSSGIQRKPVGISDEEWKVVCAERGLVPMQLKGNRHERRKQMALMRRGKKR